MFSQFYTPYNDMAFRRLFVGASLFLRVLIGPVPSLISLHLFGLQLHRYRVVVPYAALYIYEVCIKQKFPY